MLCIKALIIYWVIVYNGLGNFPIFRSFLPNIIPSISSTLRTFLQIQYQCRAGLSASDLIAQGAAFAHSISELHIII